MWDKSLHFTNVFYFNPLLDFLVRVILVALLFLRNLFFFHSSMRGRVLRLATWPSVGWLGRSISQFDNVAPADLHIDSTSASQWIPTPGRAKARGSGIVESLGQRKIGSKNPIFGARKLFDRNLLDNHPFPVTLRNFMKTDETRLFLRLKSFRTDVLPSWKNAWLFTQWCRFVCTFSRRL